MYLSWIAHLLLGFEAGNTTCGHILRLVVLLDGGRSGEGSIIYRQVYCNQKVLN